MAAPNIPNLLSSTTTSGSSSTLPSSSRTAGIPRLTSRRGGFARGANANRTSFTTARVGAHLDDDDESGFGGMTTQRRRRQPQSDLDVQSTDSDAAVSRLSAVEVGYLRDEFAGWFVGGGEGGRSVGDFAGGGAGGVRGRGGIVGGGRGGFAIRGGGDLSARRGTRRMPVINRGTYCRTTAIDQLVDRFLSTTTTKDNSNNATQKKQIISLGAGTDTRYFRLREQGRTKDLIYHEFDFPDVSNLKRAVVIKHASILQDDPNEVLFPPASTPSDDLEWGFSTNTQQESNSASERNIKYIFHPLDIRHLPSQPLSSFKGLQTDIPTLIISECCLCYLSVSTAQDIISHFTKSIANLGIVLYEPIGPDDPFGQMMKVNLKARGLVMPTVVEYGDLDAQKRRLSDAGFRTTNSAESEGGNDDGRGKERTGGSDAVDIETVWEKWITSEEKERVDALEGLDEVEEWVVLARHYAVVWGWRGEGFDVW